MQLAEHPVDPSARLPFTLHPLGEWCSRAGDRVVVESVTGPVYCDPLVGELLDATSPVPADPAGGARACRRYVTDVDGRDHVLLLASLSTPSRSRPIALARYVRVPSTRAAVASVVVERSMRRRGIAARLFADLVAIASARGIERFRVDARVCDPAGLRLVRAVAIRRAVVWAGAAPTLELPLADMG